MKNTHSSFMLSITWHCCFPSLCWKTVIFGVHIPKLCLSLTTCELKVQNSLLQYAKLTNHYKLLSQSKINEWLVVSRPLNYDDFLKFRHNNSEERQAHFEPNKRHKRNHRPVSVSFFCNMFYVAFFHAFMGICNIIHRVSKKNIHLYYWL